MPKTFTPLTTPPKKRERAHPSGAPIFSRPDLEFINRQAEEALPRLIELGLVQATDNLTTHLNSHEALSDFKEEPPAPSPFRSTALKTPLPQSDDSPTQQLLAKIESYLTTFQEA